MERKKKSMNKEARSFCTDRQTTEDLNLLGKYKTDSIFSLYNRTRTKGGEKLLETYFQHPLTEAAAIEERQRSISSLVSKALAFPVEEKELEALEQYLTSFAPVGKVKLFTEVLKRRSVALAGMKEEQDHVYTLLTEGLKALLKLRDWFRGTLTGMESGYLQKLTGRYSALLENKLLDQFEAHIAGDRLSVMQQSKYESFLRGDNHETFNSLLRDCYELDVFLGVAQLMEENNYCCPVILHGKALLKLKGAYHPGLKKAIGNDLQLDARQNMLFLTGANMAGKSTFMKTIGICCYLAHLGFPVPAKEMETSVYDGLYSSINLPDNISKGYSHFYAEVLRVKEVAKEVAAGKKLLIIFDELFKGTNVKDAFDATSGVARAMLDYKQSLFVLSTHIVEVGALLQKEAVGIQYKYMPSLLEANATRYTYTLQEGISDDRHGMMIIRQEGIFDLFPSKKLRYS
ncbi:DNA mismatch repair protein [Pseudoflavitalea sp. G-6-1-2]|uniref:MutS-related protein n=1 Tax=Pseudoflavitalea sp. G-6-1-2 TaxID=2728841 RepID=UPI001469A16A|nr:DNA mismatch repair protein [Pseudoflavitalea sp. G-6-1-2]NML21865.1 DNA mismatch repair protein [Pseudoflavitalea sp. G-6-1-2]